MRNSSKCITYGCSERTPGCNPGVKLDYIQHLECVKHLQLHPQRTGANRMGALPLYCCLTDFIFPCEDCFPALISFDYHAPMPRVFLSQGNWEQIFWTVKPMNSQICFSLGVYCLGSK